MCLRRAARMAHETAAETDMRLRQLSADAMWLAGPQPGIQGTRRWTFGSAGAETSWFRCRSPLRTATRLSSSSPARQGCCKYAYDLPAEILNGRQKLTMGWTSRRCQ